MQWLKARFFGVTFLALGLLLAGYAVSRGGYWLLLIWPALALLLAGLAYLWLGVRVFGKTKAGTRRLPARLVLFPYCFTNWLGWRALRFVVREDVWNEAAPNLYVGRRAYAHELPPNVAVVVDLTAEFIEPWAVRNGRLYHSLPILDAYVPHTDAEVLALATELAQTSDPVYVHCAEGHGRAAMIVALILVARGLADDAESAINHLKTIRPRINLRPHQRQALERWVRQLPATETHSGADT